jgi:hypothetical protein
VLRPASETLQVSSHSRGASGRRVRSSEAPVLFVLFGIAFWRRPDSVEQIGLSWVESAVTLRIISVDGHHPGD